LVPQFEDLSMVLALLPLWNHVVFSFGPTIWRPFHGFGLVTPTEQCSFWFGPTIWWPFHGFGLVNPMDVGPTIWGPFHGFGLVTPIWHHVVFDLVPQFEDPYMVLASLLN
jgi:RNA polymerase-interacting CarD/CdnL/TRCF family regulator